MPGTRRFAEKAQISPEVVRAAREDLKAYRQGPWFKAGAWSVSHHNFQEATKPPTAVPNQATLVDITGRVIEQLPGIALTTDEKVTLAAGLSDAGITEMHVTLFIHSAVGQEHVRAVSRLGLPMKIVQIVYSLEDIERAAHAGAHIVEIIGLGRRSLVGSHGGEPVQDQTEQIAVSLEKVRKAKALGLEARAAINGIGVTDASYVPFFGSAMAEAGADSIYIADGPAGLAPRAAHYLMGLLKKSAGSVKTGVHFHNDFGLGLGNATGALEAGAEIFDVSVNGIGERAGQVDLAQLALVLRVFYGIETSVRLKQLNSLSRLVQDLSRQRLPSIYPIVGEAAFGSAVEFVQKQDVYVDRALHIPIAPELVGGKHALPQGRHTGPFGLIHRAERLGYGIPEDEVTPALGDLDKWFEIRKREMTDAEFISLVEFHGGERMDVP